MLYYILKVLLYIPLQIFFPTRRIGGKIPKGKYILVCNHRSNADVIVLHNLLWCKPHILAKKELFKGVLKPIMNITGSICVDRENVSLSTIKNCLSVLKQNKKLFIFPEGTRSKDDNKEFNEIKSGVVMFAVKGQSKILPLYLKKKPKLFRFNSLVVGSPISLEEYYGSKITQDITDKCGDIIVKNLNEISNKS